MYLGNYEDRIDQRHEIAQWLLEQPADSITREALCGLVAAGLKRDTDPVDPIADAQRERWRGTLESLADFARARISQALEIENEPELGLALNASDEVVMNVQYHPSRTMEPLRRTLAYLDAAEQKLKPRAAGRVAEARRSLLLAQEVLAVPIR